MVYDGAVKTVSVPHEGAGERTARCQEGLVVKIRPKTTQQKANQNDTRPTLYTSIVISNDTFLPFDREILQRSGEQPGMASDQRAID